MVEDRTGPKHQHDRLYTITDKGKSIIRELENEGAYLEEIFQNVSFSSKEDFINGVKLQLQVQGNVDEDGFVIDSYDEILTEFLPHIPLRREVTRHNIVLEILGWKKIEETTYKFKIRIFCIKCKNSFITEIEIAYDLETYNPNPGSIRISCGNCNTVYSLNTYFNNWYIEDNEIS